MAATKLLAIAAGSTLAVGAGIGGYQLATSTEADVRGSDASGAAALSASSTCGDLETALDEIDLTDLVGGRDVDGEVTLVAGVDDVRAAASGSATTGAVVLDGRLGADEAAAEVATTIGLADPTTVAELKRPHTDQVDDARIRMMCTDLDLAGATLHVTTSTLTTDPDPTEGPAQLDDGRVGADAEVDGEADAGADAGVGEDGVDASASEEETGTSADAEANVDGPDEPDAPTDAEPTDAEPTDEPTDAPTDPDVA